MAQVWCGSQIKSVLRAKGATSPYIESQNVLVCLKDSVTITTEQLKNSSSA